MSYRPAHPHPSLRPLDGFPKWCSMSCTSSVWQAYEGMLNGKTTADLVPLDRPFQDVTGRIRSGAEQAKARGTHHFKMQDYAEACAQYRSAERYALALGDDEVLSALYGNIAECLVRMDRFHEAAWAATAGLCLCDDGAELFVKNCFRRSKAWHGLALSEHSAPASVPPPGPASPSACAPAASYASLALVDLDYCLHHKPREKLFLKFRDQLVSKSTVEVEGQRFH